MSVNFIIYINYINKYLYYINMTCNIIQSNNITTNSTNMVTQPNTNNFIISHLTREMDVLIPTFSDYNTFLKNNYKQSFLKEICKFYKLKISGNKPILNNRIYLYLLSCNSAIILQKYCRRYFVQTYFKLIGPALQNRSLCMNSTDFFTFENINDIKYNNFFSYKEEDNSIWGFSIISIYNLFIKSDKQTINPYNRNIIDLTYLNDVKHLIKLNKIFNNPINIILNDNVECISEKKKIEFKCLELFQYIDELGNYTDISWFTSLTSNLLIQFLRELYDIWQYRLQLDIKTKQEICYPDGNPFKYINFNHLHNYTFIYLQKTILSVIEQFIKSGISNVSRNLGANYVLCGLTLVNDNAAIAMPWLYQSVATI